jgi:hypothetical protein
MFLSLALPGAVAMWFNAQGRPLPGGAFNLLLFVAAVVGWPVLAFAKRVTRIRGGRPLDAAAFARGVRKAAPAISEQFALAVRNALAAAYCIPAELIGCVDSRRHIRALSVIYEPLAVEIVAQVCRDQSIESDARRLRAVAECLRTHRPSTVADLVELLHTEMASQQLVAR